MASNRNPEAADALIKLRPELDLTDESHELLRLSFNAGLAGEAPALK